MTARGTVPERCSIAPQILPRPWRQDAEEKGQITLFRNQKLEIYYLNLQLASS